MCEGSRAQRVSHTLWRSHARKSLLQSMLAQFMWGREAACPQAAQGAAATNCPSCAGSPTSIKYTLRAQVAVVLIRSYEFILIAVYKESNAPQTYCLHGTCRLLVHRYTNSIPAVKLVALQVRSIIWWSHLYIDVVGSHRWLCDGCALGAL